MNTKQRRKKRHQERMRLLKFNRQLDKEHKRKVKADPFYGIA